MKYVLQGFIKRANQMQATAISKKLFGEWINWIYGRPLKPWPHYWAMIPVRLEKQSIKQGRGTPRFD